MLVARWTPLLVMDDPEAVTAMINQGGKIAARLKPSGLVDRYRAMLLPLHKGHCDVNGWPSLKDLNFSMRTRNCLVWAGIESVEELTKFSTSELLMIPNFGRVILKEVQNNLNAHGLGLRVS